MKKPIKLGSLSCGLLGTSVAGLIILLVSTAEAQNNSWTNTNGGKWEDAANWLLGVPPSASQSGVFITNAAPALSTRQVAIDATTTNFPDTLTINNLAYSPACCSTEQFLIRDLGSNSRFRVLNSATIAPAGTLMISNATMDVGSGGASVFVIGYTPLTFMTLETLSTLRVIDGTLSASASIRIGAASTSTGALSLVNSQLNGPLSQLYVGLAGHGRMILSNGSVSVSSLKCGNFIGSVGTLTVAGGTNAVISSLDIGADGSRGRAWVTDGALGGLTITIGNSGDGIVTVSNGLFSGRYCSIATSGSGTGRLDVVGGLSQFLHTLTVGSFNCTGTGAVNVAGGSLVITNTGFDPG